MGSANLTDHIWTVSNVAAQNSIEDKQSVVKAVIAAGINRHMPAWKDRLSDVEIKMLTFYIHELGGGK